MIPEFTKREREILQLLYAGHSNREIADILVVSEHTVKWHNKQIFKKLEVTSRTGAIARMRQYEHERAIKTPYKPIHFPCKPKVLKNQELILDTLQKIKPSLNQIKQIKQQIPSFIALIPCHEASAYHSSQTREIIELLDHYDIPYRIYNPEGDIYSQYIMLNQAITEGAAGIILCALDYEPLEEILAVVEERNLPIVHIAGFDKGYGGVIIAGKDNTYQMGYKIGEFAANIINEKFEGRADVLVLDFPSLDVLVERTKGMIDGLMKNAPRSTIIGQRIGGTRENGRKSVNSILRDGMRFDILLSLNDAGAIGAVDSLEKYDIPPDEVHIVSIDVEPRVKQYLRKDHFFRGSLSVGRSDASFAAVASLIHMITKNPLPERIVIPLKHIITKEDLQ